MPPTAAKPYLTPEQQALFRERGLLQLKGAAGRSQVSSLREYVLEELERLKVWASGKSLSASLKQLPAFQQITRLSGMIRLPETPSPLISPGLYADMEALAEGKLAAAPGQLLLSLPNQGEWTLEGLNWHTDVAPEKQRVPGIQAFVLVDDVLPRGGATLAMAGSHRLAEQGEAGRTFRERLRRNENLELEMRARDFSILEMSGQAGDVYLMDMRTLHTPSINASRKLRIMATVRYLAA